MANGVINEFKTCKLCKCKLLLDSIYSYEGYCYRCFPLPYDLESNEGNVFCFSCLYHFLPKRWCNSPLGEYKPVYWKGDSCKYPFDCKFYRKVMI